MNDSSTSFDKQEQNVDSDSWNVILNYENWHLETKEIYPKDSDLKIELSEPGKYDSILRLRISNPHEAKECYITGIEGGGYLHIKEGEETGQSVKIEGDNLIISIGFNFLSINLKDLNLNWNLRPDIAEVFEFYDLQNDYLLRGEVKIHRIDKKGQVIWSFGAKDIWVNIEGLPEVQIEEKMIRLTDFNAEVFLIDFDGKLIKDKTK